MTEDRLEKVLAYIDTHIQQKIYLVDCANVAGYSPFYFSKLFSEAMGMPVTGYIRIRKLQYAVVSLLEGHKVLDVALMYAFDSHEGFTRAFCQLFGSTPRTVRKYLTSYTVPMYVVPNISNRRISMNELDYLHSMHQLVYEVLENSLEEARVGFCSKIEVVLLPDNQVKISDNGRGIPLSPDLQVSRAVLDKILAGTPITNSEFSQMGDLVQAGMQTVNSLCERMQVTVYRGWEQFEQEYIRGVAQHELQKNQSAIPRSGMEIILKPDTAIFGDRRFSRKMLCDWLDNKLADHRNLEIIRTGLDE